MEDKLEFTRRTLENKVVTYNFELLNEEVLEASREMDKLIVKCMLQKINKYNLN